MEFIIEIERTVLSKLSCFQIRGHTTETEYPNQKSTTREKIKHLVFGEWRVTIEEDAREQSGPTDEEKMEEIVKRQLGKYRKRMIQELKEFRKRSDA